ncbi:MAG: ATP-binding cassette domain-containing protein [Planctomycetes bacterium]|nr:ATP-binding cassette domain-containing protein [Planctomycetota bacterium]
MALIQLNELSIGFRGPLLLDHVSCQIEAGGRIGLLGRNGSGKTTLMRIISGVVQPDEGKCIIAPRTKVSLLPQDVPDHLQGTVDEVVRQGLPAEQQDPAHAWEADRLIDRLLAKMDLDPALEVQSLSSGWKRRVLLAQTLVAEPDVLLLDEPTNHLDIDAIAWLEEFLLRWPATLMFVTHDRAFLRNLATRILEIDRGRIFDWSCDYDTFLARKEAALSAEEKQNALFDKKLAQEEVWIRQGIKARRVRNEGRVRALEKMRVQRSERRDKVGTSRLQIQEGGRSGMLVAEVKNICFTYGNEEGDETNDRPIVNDFTTSIMRGDKIGIIGPNGAGKTTLLRLLLGQLKPQAGKVRLGTNLEIAYFDQLRDQLDEEATVQESLGEGSDTIMMNGVRKHVLGYLQDFLFAPERARTQVKFLSGGERNRVLLAKLFAKPANVIVLDEPTNDLDTETLELLEERLVQFEGTIMLVSHDRAFLNNVVTSTIVFEPTGAREYVGGYDDWLRQRSEQMAMPEAAAKPKALPKQALKPDANPSRNRKLAYKEKRELETLPKTIEQLESAAAQLHEVMAAPEFYKQPSEQIAERQAELKEIEQKLATAYQRWEELELCD